MAWPNKEWISWETWKKVGLIWIVTLLNLVLNAISVYLLWDMVNLLKVALQHGAATVAQGQQIAVVQAPIAANVTG